ncbi:NUDIX domain-containing protein [Sinomonas sp. R1AF57]|uniref:NUDIX domain-containing protein n=1 Tax=Sinomonas sp. R1AF57 TaxID=2020377 RepID=UPI000B60BC28|nr:NUDIX domain-containing protein [Sinomonas sp. R1AF57]ASN53752.1 DNA mismatch repair protein MutT [Sinomonas sp. R1AF57]
MAVLSAGILLYRRGDEGLEVWIAHMGGPFWARKDEHAWSIPKGLYDEGDDPFSAAQREFAEEMGTPPPDADYVPLGEFRQPSGKRLTAFAAEADFAPEQITSNTFPLEWPRGSGRVIDVPEIDRAEWFPEDVARTKLVKGQIPILDALLSRLR